MPSEATFHSLTNVAFNTSLQTEEKRRHGFRLIYIPLEELERAREFDDPSNRFRVMKFDKSRIFEARETSSNCICCGPHSIFNMRVYRHQDRQTRDLGIVGYW